MRKISKAFARPLAAISISGLALTAMTVLSAPNASAMTCLLKITSLGSNQYKVSVGCNDLFVDGFHLWGEDEFFDDDLNFSAQGSSAIVSGDILDEDWGEDEIFAQVSAHDLDGNGFAIRSNTVSGSY
jgi:hypothetical protein